MAARRACWLVKSEPASYAWEQLVADGSTCWDGVRNHAARKHLAAMHKGDPVLYYHSNQGKEVVGVARVVREAYPDPSADDPRWLSVDLRPVKALKEPVSLARIRQEAKLSEIPLVQQSRLSVMPIPKPAFDRILALGRTRL